jgi:3-oxoacyl-[acyl-carrier-protein] synthase III
MSDPPGHLATTLESVATYLPEQRVAIAELAGALGLTAMQVKVFQRFHGLAEVRVDPGVSLVELLLRAARRLDGLRGREHLVRYVLHARTFPVVVPYPVSPPHEVGRRLGLDRATAFTVTHHACATGLLAVDMAGRLLAADGDPRALALVLAGEKTFTHDARLLPETSIFGEGAAACLVGCSGDRNRLLAYAASQRGDLDDEAAAAAGDDSDGDGDGGTGTGLLARFQREYPACLREVLLAAVSRAGLRLDEISLILPHNVNVVSWQRLARRMGFPPERVLLHNVPTLGHIFCADAFVNYQTALAGGMLSAGDRYLVAAAGAARGATFAAMVFQH